MQNECVVRARDLLVLLLHYGDVCLQGMGMCGASDGRDSVLWPWARGLRWRRGAGWAKAWATGDA